MLPTNIIDVISTYPERPARWLGETEARPPAQSDVDLLARAMVEVLGDGHRESLVKCISIWSAVQAGTFTADQTTIDLLKSYPGNRSNRSRADAVVRASWGATRGANLANDPNYFDETLSWAATFWNFNSTTTQCTRRRDLPASGPDQSASAMHATTEQNFGDDDASKSEPFNREQCAKDLVSSYVEAIETSSPRDLFDPEREEVHTGLVLRAGREVITALGNPELWTADHGAHIGRLLVELRIYLTWMALQDRSIYRQFQEYGAGKAKLYSLIAGELPEEVRTPEVQESINLLSSLSRNDSIIDHRIVDTRDSFAGGKSLRTMAEECGLLYLYRHAYMPASGISHSEWWSVEMHSMERCYNILHRGHLIASLSLPSGGSEQLADAWLDSLYTLIVVSLEALNVNPANVHSAFGWMEDDDAAGAQSSS